jgi:hypothetical protein
LQEPFEPPCAYLVTISRLSFSSLRIQDDVPML